MPLAIAIEWVWYMHLCVMKVSHIYKSRGEKQHLTRHIISIVKHHKHSKCVLIKKPIFQRRRENMIRMLKYLKEWPESEIYSLYSYITIMYIQNWSTKYCKFLCNALWLLPMSVFRNNLEVQKGLIRYNQFQSKGAYMDGKQRH